MTKIQVNTKPVATRYGNPGETTIEYSLGPDATGGLITFTPESGGVRVDLCRHDPGVRVVVGGKGAIPTADNVRQWGDTTLHRVRSMLTEESAKRGTASLLPIIHQLIVAVRDDVVSEVVAKVCFRVRESDRGLRYDTSAVLVYTDHVEAEIDFDDLYNNPVPEILARLSDESQPLTPTTTLTLDLTTGAVTSATTMTWNV